MFTKLLNFLESLSQKYSLTNRIFVKLVNLVRAYQFTLFLDDSLLLFRNYVNQTQYNVVRAKKLSRYRQHRISDIVLHTNFELLCEFVKKNYSDIMVPDEMLDTMSPEDKYRCKKMRELYYWWTYQYDPENSTRHEIIQRTTECIELQLTFQNGELHD